MQPAKRDTPLCEHSKWPATKGCARIGPSLRVAAKKRVCGVAPLGKGWPLPARRALHPSLSRGNADAKLTLAGPKSSLTLIRRLLFGDVLVDLRHVQPHHLIDQRIERAGGQRTGF